MFLSRAVLLWYDVTMTQVERPYAETLSWVSVYFWGTLSDRIGRKPVLLICLACGITSTAAFGVSATFVQALVFRMITGASYGDVP